MKALFLSIWLLLSMVLISSAMIVSINLTWDYNQNYNVQEGSIVQIVAYRTGTASNQSGGADNNFDVVGEYNDLPVYNVDSTPINHHIVYETQVDQGVNNYYVSESFELLENYNRIYIRIFSEEITDMDYVAYSYWGLTPIVNRPGGKKPIVLLYVNYNQITNQNYFTTQDYFEVIPEVPTGNLIALGILSFLLWRMNKYYYERKVLYKKRGLGDIKSLTSISSKKSDG